MKTIEEIYGEMAAAFANATGQGVGRAGDLAARLYAVAAQVKGLYAQSEWVARQCFPQTAAGDFLDKHARLRGLSRRGAARAEGMLRFFVERAGSADLSIAAGTVCMTAAQERFETVEDAALPAGALYADAPARALEPGAAGNVPGGSVLSMAVAPVGVSRCGNPAAFQGGADAEGDESLRARVLETFKRLPNGANAAFYEQGAMSFPEVAAAAVLPRNRGVGTVDVVVSTAQGMPDGALLERLRAYFEARREIAVDVGVLAPVGRTVDVSVKVKPAEGAAFDDVKAAVESRLRGWFGGEALGRSVLRARLGELVFTAEGVENYALTAPAADVTVGPAELPRLGSLTVEALA